MEQLVRLSKQNNPITDSRLVGKTFSKRHGNVLRDIQNILQQADSDPALKTELSRMFAEFTYLDANNKSQRAYAMTQDGFSLLVMGFTGSKAMGFKLEYMRQFSAMRQQLLKLQQAQTATDPVKLLEPHTQRDEQLENSKKVAGYYWQNGGTYKIIEHNRLSCLLHTGKRPNVIKSEAKAAGVPSKHRTSAKEVLRHTQPEIACCMSLCDDLTSRGIALSEAATVSLQARSVYAGLLRLGVHVPELQR